MKRSGIHTKLQAVSAIVMILALVWLSVSMPFVLASQKSLANNTECPSQQSPFAGTEEEDAASGNPVDEKKPKTLNNFTEEYLHHIDGDHISSNYLSHTNAQDARIYIAYHGEPLVPPPNAA